MKIIFIPFILLITSCSQYEYHVQYEKCNWQTGSTQFVGNLDPIYYPRDRELYNQWNKINNVCDFSYTRNEIK